MTPSSISFQSLAAFGEQAEHFLTIRTLAKIALVGIIAASSVFALLLWQNEPKVHLIVAEAPAHETAAIIAAPALAALPEVPSRPARIPFDLARSKHFQSVAGISIRIKANGKVPAFCDLDIRSGSRKASLHRIRLGEAVWFSARDGHSIALTVSRIDEHQFRGYYSTRAENPLHYRPTRKRRR